MDIFDFYQRLPFYLAIVLPALAVLLSVVAGVRSKSRLEFLTPLVGIMLGTTSSILLLFLLYESIVGVRFVAILSSLYMLGLAVSELVPGLTKEVT